MQTNGKTSPLRAYDRPQEWGRKRRKWDAKNYRSTAKRKALKEAREDV